ncbi:AbrB/MazE/SpoVT family DNA-binding domain-containing protein [Clostridium sp. WILCCON 0269]|uniref:AbrB/MazE/SpoVT family DNA-binding domain-containing protein n=1 Tax=Candidatus Clostridium eludens TaxID=3381663 RepID=A0ABW8SNU9_9CLOT
MKSTGIVRKVDQLGRVVLPKELRKRFDMPGGTPLEMGVNGDEIILGKYKPACVFCGGTKDVVKYKDKNVCHKCLDNLKTSRLR